jgi:hypothetical protein
MNSFYLKILSIIFIILLTIKIVQNRSLEKFDVSKCHGKRDGIAGCRICCKTIYKNNYNKCLDKCMSF